MEFLTLYNNSPDADWRSYKNNDGKGSTATNAKYLVALMNDASD